MTRDQFILWSLWGGALAWRLALALPLAFFASRTFQYSLYMPVAVIVSTLGVVHGLRTRQITDHGLVLFIVLAAGPVLLGYAATTGNALFIGMSALAAANAVVCGVWVYRSRKQLVLRRGNGVRLVAVGLASGFVVCAVFAVAALSQGAVLDFSRLPGKVLNGIMVFSVMLFLAPVFEEPVFRGWLAWMPRSNKAVVAAVFLAQALVFWVGHSYFAGSRNLDFFVLVPAAGLVLGAAALGTKSLVPSLVGHSLINAFYVTFLRWPV